MKKKAEIDIFERVQIQEELETVVSWLREHKTSQTGIKPPDKVIDIFKENNWLYTGRAYRGIHWGSYHKPYTSSKGKFKISDTFETKKFSPWSKKMRIAASFAAIGALDPWITMNNPRFTLTQRVCMRVIEYGGAGIVLRADVSKALDIAKATKYIEDFGLRIPILPEAEVLVTKPTKGKVIRHYHPKLCQKNERK